MTLSIKGSKITSIKGSDPFLNIEPTVGVLQFLTVYRNIYILQYSGIRKKREKGIITYEYNTYSEIISTTLNGFC